MTDLTAALAAIDAANAADPTLEGGKPAALLYGERMTAELAHLSPDASEVLQIAARGQHIERWKLPRKDYPEGKAGYYAWRREQGRRHGERVAGIMAEAGYSEADQTRVGVLLRKEKLKADPEVQALEDAICFTFIRWYLGPFAETRTPEDLVKIVEKTARKMSATARQKALATFPMPEELASSFE
ncbi:DUF4202 domain-containing protein [Thalassobius sp. Cn5-15]|uniref:DUF4202 domain-containing protein n=1 Tax=Thalassobius sp. Cn5-15 TaxID=2917763 RepID=UPI001EF2A201|nr:DUF4202 domain-containing protein [Thalassobius sp. Cn5-15]MCG7494484.1 DUF4202 domain-containing protein [Thalassobius sp. Cn5-15]